MSIQLKILKVNFVPIENGCDIIIYLYRRQHFGHVLSVYAYFISSEVKWKNFNPGQHEICDVTSVLEVW